MTVVPDPFILLVVDDDQNDVLIIQRVLSSLGMRMQCYSVADGDEAKDYLAGEGQYADRHLWPFPHVVLLDYWMPRLSGLEVLSWMRGVRQLTDLPVVLLSGGLAPPQQQAAEAWGAVFCNKGVATDEFAAVLIEALRYALDRVDNGAAGLPTQSSNLPPEPKQ